MQEELEQRTVSVSIQAAKLPSGAIALVFNPYGLPPREKKEVEWPGLRWSVSVAITEDEGETFPLQRVIEPGSGFTGAENRLENAAFEYVQETIEQIARYLGLALKVLEVRRIAGLCDFAAENDAI